MRDTAGNAEQQECGQQENGTGACAGGCAVTAPCCQTAIAACVGASCYCGCGPGTGLCFAGTGIVPATGGTATAVTCPDAATGSCCATGAADCQTGGCDEVIDSCAGCGIGPATHFCNVPAYASGACARPSPSGGKSGSRTWDRHEAAVRRLAQRAD